MLTDELSALIDGELSRAETDAMLERMRRNPQLRAEWTRQHYVRLAMFENPPETVTSDFADGVMARVADEAIHVQASVPPARPVCKPTASARTQKRRWIGPVSGFAMAASVAAVAVVVLDSGGLGPSPRSPAAATTVAASSSAPHAEQVARSESGGDQPTGDRASKTVAASDNSSPSAGARTVVTASKTWSRFGMSALTLTPGQSGSANNTQMVRLINGQQPSSALKSERSTTSSQLLLGNHSQSASAQKQSVAGSGDHLLEATADTASSQDAAHTTSAALKSDTASQ